MVGWIKCYAQDVFEPEMRVVACGQGAKQILLNILLVLDLLALCFFKPSPSLGSVHIRPHPHPKNKVLFFGFEKDLAWRPLFG